MLSHVAKEFVVLRYKPRLCFGLQINWSWLFGPSKFLLALGVKTRLQRWKLGFQSSLTIMLYFLSLPLHSIDLNPNSSYSLPYIFHNVCFWDFVVKSVIPLLKLFFILIACIAWKDVIILWGEISYRPFLGVTFVEEPGLLIVFWHWQFFQL